MTISKVVLKSHITGQPCEKVGAVEQSQQNIDCHQRCV